MGMSSIILIDLSSIFWTYWHASESGEVSTAKRRTLQLIESLSRDHDFTAVCRDCPPYKRTEIYPDYKAGRERPPLAIEELRECVVELEKFGVKCYASKGYEADDIIATLSKQAIEKGIEVFIAGKDKDLLQINGVKITDPFSENHDEITAMIKFGVPSDFVRDILALSGDTSDNVPGVPGIGPKKAIQIIEAVESVKNYLDGKFNAETFSALPESLRKSLVDNYDLLEMSYNLVGLDYSAPVSLDLSIPEAANNAPMDESKKEIKGTDAVIEITPTEQVSKTELIKADPKNGNWSLALEPINLNSAWSLSKIMHQSRMFGNFPNAEAIMAIILRGRSLGIDAVTAVSSFHVIEGKPTMHADLIVGLVLKSEICEYFDLIETTENKAVYVTKRSGRPEVRMEYTIDEAKKWGALNPTRSGKKSNWESRPKTMLRRRCSTELARAVYPDIVVGLYDPDEVERQ